MAARPRHRGRSAIAAGALLLAGLAGCSSSAPAARPGTPAPGSARVLVAFGLERNTSGLAHLLDEISDPMSPRHLDLLTPAEVRSRFGATPAAMRRASSALRSLGVTDLTADPTGTAVVGQVTAADARAKLGVPLVVQRRDDGSEVIVPQRDPKVPAALRGLVHEVVGLTATLRPATGTLVGAPTAGTTPDPGCGDADLASDAAVADTLRYFGTDELYDRGDEGQGVTIALWSVDRFDPAPVTAFTTCRQSPTVVPKVVTVPLTPPAPAGDEVTLDVIMAGWTAPKATLLVVQFDPFTSPVFPLVQTLRSGSTGPDRVDVLSTSITFCEAGLPDDELALSEHLFMALAATGVTSLSAAGDHGVAGCHPSSDEPGAAYPASSPYVTAVGGTTFELDGGRIVGERAWREPDHRSAGGGGTSGRLDRPDFQAAAGIDGAKRQYPDVASFAAVNRLNAIPTCDPSTCTWKSLGGTSAPAPTLAANLALVLEDAAAKGGPRRLGWINPLLGGLQRARRSPLVDLTDGSTAILGNACCRAEPGYDQATGWGSLVHIDLLARRVAALPRDR